VRILSLLPSATEIVYALGLEDELVGVTHECDWPPEARAKPAVTASAVPPAASPADIDALVSATLAGGAPLYRLDDRLVQELRPELVLTQDLCAVCAVPSGHVDEALRTIGCSAEVLSLDPASLDDVLDCLRRVGRATGTESRAEQVVAHLQRRIAAVGRAVAGRRRPPTFVLEWSDPPFTAGHWVPDMVEAAGGDPVLASAGAPSVRVAWSSIARACPEVVVFAPCGYDLDQAAAEAGRLLARPELSGARTILVADASACFSRPGPRLVDGVEALASALHPGAGLDPRPEVVQRVR
jgi:iron complex transport system substrate-binding protein